MTIEQRIKKSGAVKKEFMDWNEVKTICILATKDNCYNEAAINAFAAASQKACETILFMPSETKTKGSSNKLTKKDLNILGLPKAEALPQLTSRSFDVLIDCNFNPYPSAKWMAGVIRAKFKVGAAGSFYDNYFDICIDLNNSRDQKAYLEHVAGYLKMIRTKNA